MRTVRASASSANIVGDGGSRVLFAFLFGLDALRGVRDTQQTLLGDEFSRGFADAVSFVLHAHQSHLQIADELHLVGGEATRLLFRESSGALLQHLERGRSILGVVIARMRYVRPQQLVIGLGLLEFS